MTRCLTSTLALLVAPLFSAELAPTLEVLPLNSTLEKVTIPRYDENHRRAAYLKTDLMEILADGPEINGAQPILVDCTGIQLRIVAPDGAESLAVDMDRARYRLGPGILKVDERITANSPRFDLVGDGGVFHLQTRRGFVFGPLTCHIKPEPKPQANLMKAPVFFALATSLLVADESRPRELSDAQLLALATDSAPVGHKLEQRTKQHQPVSESMEQQRKKADALLAQFADDVEDSALQNLIQNQEKQPSPPQAQNAIPKPSLEVQCDAGAFFDGEENLLVFLRNIIVTEERFKLKAAKELKLYFQDAPEAEKPADLDVDEAANPADLDIPSVEMGDIDRLIATGGVQVTGVDKEGNPFETRAETASYDAKTQLLILKGGRPYFFRKKGDAQFALEARTPDAYVQIDLSGEKIQADTSRTGWGFAADGLRQQN